MARSVKEIKDDMTAMWIDQAAVRTAYALDENKTFDEQFSRISLESIWFYVVAFCTWTLEKLFDLHRDEITKAINELKPHSLRWYVNKAKAFMYGKALIPGADVYDTSGMTDERIDEMKVVRYAAAVEKAAIVYLKVAGAGPAPISAEAYEGLKAYIKEIKDAGVVVELINEPAEHFRVRMTVYYDPMVLDISGVSPSGETPVRDTIRRFNCN